MTTILITKTKIFTDHRVTMRGSADEDSTHFDKRPSYRDAKRKVHTHKNLTLNGVKVVKSFAAGTVREIDIVLGALERSDSVEPVVKLMPNTGATFIFLDEKGGLHHYRSGFRGGDAVKVIDKPIHVDGSGGNVFDLITPVMKQLRTKVTDEELFYFCAYLDPVSSVSYDVTDRATGETTLVEYNQAAAAAAVSKVFTLMGSVKLPKKMSYRRVGTDDDNYN